MHGPQDIVPHTNTVPHGPQDIIAKTPAITDALHHTLARIEEKFGNKITTAEHIATHSKSRYAHQEYEKNLADALALQIDQQPEYIDAHQYDIHTLSALFEHTKRDAMEFLRNQPSVRMQLCFSPLDNIEAKIVVPTSGTPEANEHALYASDIDTNRLPHALIVDRGKRMRTHHPEVTLPQRFHLFHKDQNIRKMFIAEHHETLIPFIKEYLATAMPTDYFLDDTLTSTPRVLRVGSLYILTQTNPLIYTEKHLKNYAGTNLFLKIFTTREEYIAYEKNTLVKLEKQKHRFTNIQTAWGKGFESLVTMIKHIEQENQNKPYKTATDKKIDLMLNDIQTKPLNNDLLNQKRTTIGTLIQDRLNAIDAMSTTIHAQINTGI